MPDQQSAVSSEKADWIKAALGLDLAAGKTGGVAGSASAAATDASGAMRKEAGPAQKEGGFLSRAKSLFEKVTGTEPTVLPADKELADSLKALSDEVAILKGQGFTTKRMMVEHADIAKRGVAAESLTDPAARAKALAQVKKSLAEQIEHVQALSQAFWKVMALKDAKPNDDEKDAIYKAAIEEMYGLKIEVPKGMDNTHFDKVFDMFGTLPKHDVKQDKLKKLFYTDSDKVGGSYNKVGGKIEMGNYGHGWDSEDYQVDGKTVSANAFSVATLHEVGHAVDEKHQIMASNAKNAGAGDWDDETVYSAATAFTKALKAAVQVNKNIRDAVLEDAVRIALQKGTTSQPDTISYDDWKPILAFLVDNCLKVKTNAKPWDSSQIVCNGRVFVEAYDGIWFSYGASARPRTRVSDYQWRSPAEWFAEVFAISWLAKKTVSGVASTIAAHLYKP